MQSGSAYLFELSASFFRDFRFTSQTEKHINIRFDGVDLLRLFLEACAFIVKPPIMNTLMLIELSENTTI